MSRLRELQRAFAAALLAGDESALAGQVVCDRFTAEQRLRVYRNNVQAGFRAALEGIFPVVARLVGGEFFGIAARAYLRAHPSRSGNLLDFGHAFADFLMGFAPAASLPYLPDVARLEWVWHEVFHAADSPPFPLARLAEVPSRAHASLRFRMHPASRLLASPFPVARIWALHQPDAEPVPEPIELDAGPDALLVIRPQVEVEVHRLAPGEHAFLSAIGAGATLGTACKRAFSTAGGCDPAAMLCRHVALGTLVDFAW